MRVTEHRLMEITASATAKAREAAAKAGRELSTGVAVASASDDPVRWAAAREAQVRTAVSSGHQRSIERARGRLDETDGVLAGAGDLVSQAQALGVELVNGTMSAAERTAAADQVDQLRATLLALADRRGGDGEYLLAGTAGTAAPFDATGAYVGTGADRVVVAGESATVTAGITGAVLTAGAGVDVLGTLATLSAALRANDPVAIAATFDPLSTAVAQLADARSRVGIRMHALDDAEQARDGLEAHLTAEIQREAGADPMDAAGRLSRAAQALEAARAASQAIAQMLR